jgi:hypothetical protein
MIIAALKETIRIMEEIGRAIPECLSREKEGGKVDNGRRD